MRVMSDIPNTVVHYDTNEQIWVDAVLAFWFEELKPEDWFATSKALDENIRHRFSDLHRVLSEQYKDKHYPKDPTERLIGNSRTALATIIVLDQFSRQLYRGHAQAFAQDAQALMIAKNMVNTGQDVELEGNQRHFIYMPFMHSENIEDQKKSVALFKAKSGGEDNTWAIDHMNIIDRFGRFPYRNKVLSRQNTPEEVEYLKSAATYGQ